MKAFTFPVIFLMIMMAGFGCHSKKTPSDPAAAMLKEFYTAYMTEFSDASPDFEKKLRAIQKKYCTPKLVKKIPAMAEEKDADPIINGQDSDTSLIKKLVIKKDPQKAGVYTVSYTAPINFSTTIHLRVIQQNDVYKVDDIW